jgi:hypothetical protein
VALVIAIAGVVIAFDVFNSFVVYAAVAAGIAFALVELVLRVRVARAAVTWRSFLDAPFVLLMVAAILLVALWRTAHFAWNQCDDDAAYLYLAQRLVLHGDLLDPLNNRRLTSLGGMSAVQALFLVRLPDSFLTLPDFFLGPVMILFGLWRSRWKRWALWGIGATFLVVLFPGNLGPSNTSPVLLPIGLGIAACSVALEMRVQETARAVVAYACVLGLLVGTATTLRLQFGLPLSLVALAIVFWPPLGLGVVQRLAGVGAGFAIVLGGWAAASWRAVGTPLFPILPGNIDPTWPANGPAHSVPSLAEFFGRLTSPLFDPPWALAVLLGIGVVALVLTRPQVAEAYRRWGLRIEVVAAAASVALVAILLWVYWNSGLPSGYPRFWAPMVLTVVLMPLVFVNRARVERSKVAFLAGLASFVLVGVALNADPNAGYREIRAVAHDVRVRSITQTPDRYANIRTEYAEAAALIPPGSKVLTAVDVPSLLVSRAYELHTLDIAGSTSPPPHLPYFRGTEAKLAWLRGHGYDYVIAVDPSASACLYSSRLAAEDIAGEHGPVYRVWAPYFVDWFEFLADLSGSTTRVEDLLVVKL